MREGITLLFCLLTTYGGIVSAAYLDMGIDRLQTQGTNVCRFIVQTSIQKGKKHIIKFIVTSISEIAQPV